MLFKHAETEKVLTQSRNRDGGFSQLHMSDNVGKEEVVHIQMVKVGSVYSISNFDVNEYV